ncbi:glycoside hydrolase family 6 protein [Terriglobus tenax]|uniref:glycoside hydrolase family 6 protein n=1 Tax=Terriglobus tenax TaxID=1111115 RepID=UPI0021E0368A|nr:glycoside hydrolase family 6 protein [Terriglobus tenax]
MNPFHNTTLFIDPSSRIGRFCVANASYSGIARLRAIAARPQAFWLDGRQLNPAQYIAATLQAAADQLVVFVVYHRPGRDNGQYSAGGSTDPVTYSQYIDGIVQATGYARPVFIVEPDGIAESSGYTPQQRARRNGCLAYAVERLATCGTVYLDMGHPGWLDAETMLGLLADIPATAHRGFSINVSSFNDDASCRSFARRLYQATGKPSVIDTSRNGNGYVPGDWCNPPGRKLGRQPLSYSEGAIDANLWIKRPSESDGTCNGGPPAGELWPEYAARL